MDYSNTIFYKICCIDSSINDLYIGHTTNFVQRKQAHKQGCKNVKSANYKCKLYKVIRENNGWDNWKMDIIAFHNCDNLLGAKTQEQKYFEEYKATLNSIEPLPKSKPKIVNDVAKKEKIIFYCNKCNIHFDSSKTQEVHNTTRKHIQKSDIVEKVTDLKNPKYTCTNCQFYANKLSNYTQHLQTAKHIRKHMETMETAKHSNLNRCDKCDKSFSRSGYWKHSKKCHKSGESKHTGSTVINELLKQNNHFKTLLVMQTNQLHDQQMKTEEQYRKSEEEKKELLMKNEEQQRKTEERENQMMDLQKQFLEAIKNGSLGNKVITVE